MIKLRRRVRSRELLFQIKEGPACRIGMGVVHTLSRRQTGGMMSRPDAMKSRKDGTKSRPDGMKSRQGAPKSRQDAMKRHPDAPKSHQDGMKSHQDVLKSHPGPTPTATSHRGRPADQLVINSDHGPTGRDVSTEFIIQSRAEKKQTKNIEVIRRRAARKATGSSKLQATHNELKCLLILGKFMQLNFQYSSKLHLRKNIQSIS